MLKYVRRAANALRRIPVGTRAVIYRALVAAAPVIGGAAKIGPEELELYLELAALVLGVSGLSLAAVNTPRDRPGA